MLTGAALLVGAGTPNALDDAAPGGPGTPSTWAPANKDGSATAKSTDSKVWYMLQNGALSEVYYPDLDTPSVRDMQFAVTDGRTFSERETDSTTHVTRPAAQDTLVYQQVTTEKSGR